MTNDKTFEKLWQTRGHQIMTDRGVEKRYLNADLSQFKIMLDLDSEKGYYFYGDCGTGKTHLLSAIIKEMFRKNVSAYFISTTRLYQQLKQNFNSENGIMQKLEEVDVLCLDDVGSERVTDWRRDELFYLIDQRYSNIKKTFVSSNKTLSELSELFDDRIASRIAGMCEVMKIEGKDRRLG